MNQDDRDRDRFLGYVFVIAVVAFLLFGIFYAGLRAGEANDPCATGSELCI